MTPYLTAANFADELWRNPEPVANLFCTDSCGAKASNFQNLFGRKFSVVVLRTPGHSTKRSGVFTVSPRRYKLKILNPVVGPVSIDVIGVVAPRSRPKKCGGDQRMNIVIGSTNTKLGVPANLIDLRSPDIASPISRARKVYVLTNSPIRAGRKAVTHSRDFVPKFFHATHFTKEMV